MVCSGERPQKFGKNRLVSEQVASIQTWELQYGHQVALELVAYGFASRMGVPGLTNLPPPLLLRLRTPTSGEIGV
jgi:hypothetical protein